MRWFNLVSALWCLVGTLLCAYRGFFWPQTVTGFVFFAANFYLFLFPFKRSHVKVPHL